MRKVVLYSLLSVDGVAESPDEYVHEFDDRMLDNLAQVIATQAAVLLGRASYEEWASYWPTSDDEPFASFINNVDKYVVTSTPLTTPWKGATAVNGSPASLVADLRDRPGDDIGVHASVTLSLAACSPTASSTSCGWSSHRPWPAPVAGCSATPGRTPGCGWSRPSARRPGRCC
jgi:dihydrofolate reductase